MHILSRYIITYDSNYKLSKVSQYHNKKEYSFLTKTEARRRKKNWNMTKNTIFLFSFDLQYVLQN